LPSRDRKKKTLLPSAVGGKKVVGEKREDLPLDAREKKRRARARTKKKK